MNRGGSQSLLPVDKRAERPLAFVMIAMAFLAALTLLGSRMSARSYNAWQSDLKNAATLQLTGLQDDTRKEQIKTAISIIKDVAPDLSPKAIGRKKERALIQPWLGGVELPEGVSLPAIISLKASPGFNADVLSERLNAAGLTHQIDTHNMWDKDVRRAKRVAHLTGSAVLLIILAASALILSFATQSAMTAQTQTLSVFLQVGASDNFITKIYLKRALWLSLGSVVIGMGLASIFMMII
ncbi:MAG: cell division protein FtsX, partial [Maricaulaceae bacterium]